MSMLCKPMWPFLLMYGSHDMRHTGFSQVNGGQRDPLEMGRHTLSRFIMLLTYILFHPLWFFALLILCFYHCISSLNQCKYFSLKKTKNFSHVSS